MAFSYLLRSAACSKIPAPLPRLSVMTDSGAITTVGTSPARQYLGLDHLKKLELPPHPSYNNVASDHSVSLVQFLNNLFTEVQEINFDEDFKACGSWSPKGGHVTMPPLGDTEVGSEAAVPISVEKRTKAVNGASWALRTSHHSDAHVKFSELAELLAKDHSRNESLYTPSILDAVELLRWGKEDLAKALSESHHWEAIHNVDMFSKFGSFFKIHVTFGLYHFTSIQGHDHSTCMANARVVTDGLSLEGDVAAVCIMS